MNQLVDSSHLSDANKCLINKTLMYQQSTRLREKNILKEPLLVIIRLQKSIEIDYTQAIRTRRHSCHLEIQLRIADQGLLTATTRELQTNLKATKTNLTFATITQCANSRTCLCNQVVDTSTMKKVASCKCHLTCKDQKLMGIQLVRRLW